MPQTMQLPRCAWFVLIVALATLTVGCNTPTAPSAVATSRAGGHVPGDGTGEDETPSDDPGTREPSAERGTAEVTEDAVKSQVEQVLALHRMLKLMILQQTAVQQELRLDADQLATVRELDADARQLVKQLMLSSENRDQVIERDVVPAAARIDQRLNSLLTVEQHERLRQLTLQEQKGPGVLLLPFVAERLEMTDQEHRAIEAIFLELKAQSDEAGWNPVKLYQMTSAAAEARDRAVAALTLQQQQRWQAMQGKPLK